MLCSAPTLAEVGEEGTELWASLELKLVADVGIIGIPSAGKSTLLSVLSNAKPKIADYPFTTLVPNLGVCELDYRTTVFADIPGNDSGLHSSDCDNCTCTSALSRCLLIRLAWARAQSSMPVDSTTSTLM